MARIEFQRLAHSYVANPRAPADWALKELDFAWEDGGAYALLGPSGCGKSTLLNIISGLLRPSQGRVLYDGKDVTGLSPAAREMLGLPSRDAGFRREPTSPHLLHDYLGLPPEHPTIDGIPELDLDPEDD